MPETATEFFTQWPQRMSHAKAEAPEIGKAFSAFFHALMKEGALDVREKELIAVGIAMAVRCAPCINTHTELALRAGATREQILEAAGVAVALQGGPTYVHLPNVVEALDALEHK